MFLALSLNRSTHRNRNGCYRLPVTAACLFLGLIGCPALSRAQTDLDSKQVDLLQQLSPDSAGAIVDLAQKAEAWKKEIDALRKVVQAIKGGTNLLSVKQAQAEAIDKIFVVAETLAKQTPAVQQVVGLNDKLRKRLDAVKSQIDAIKYNANIAPDIEEADFRKLATSIIRAKEAAAILGDLQSALALIEAARNPSQFVQTFMNQLKTNYFNKPYTIGDVQFTISQQDFTRSLFSPDANVQISVQYSGGWKVSATGLYFRYKKGQLPEPVFNKVKLQKPSLQGLIAQGLKSLGDELPAFGPVTIKSVDATDFDGSGKGGDLRVKLEIGLGQLSDVGLDKLPSLSGTVILHANGKVEVGEIGAKMALTPPIELGTSGLLIESVDMSLKPKDKKPVTLGVTISTVAGGSETLSAEIQASFGFPITKTGLSYKGTLKLGRTTTLATVWGEITSKHLTVNMEASIEGAGTLTAKGELNKQGLTAKANFTIFGIQVANSDLFLGTNGSGRFSISESISLGSEVKADTSLSGSFSPGFRKVVLEGSMSLDVDGGIFGTLSAAVDVYAVLAPAPRIDVTGHVGDFSVQFTIKNFGELYGALKDAIGKAGAQLYKDLAKAEQELSKYAAQRAQALNNAIASEAKKLHIDKISVDGGGPIDQALGKASKFGHQAEDGAAHANSVLNNIVSNPVGSASGVISNPSKIWGGRGLGLTDATHSLRIGRMSGDHAGFHQGGLDLTDDIGKAAEKLHQQLDQAAQRARLTLRFQALLQQIDKATIHKSQHARSGDIAELRVRFDRALAIPTSNDEVVLTFAIQSVGFRYHVDPRGNKSTKPVSNGEFHTGQIVFTGLSGKNKPHYEIKLPPFHTTSLWNVGTLIHDQLDALVKKFMPSAITEVPQAQRKLAIHNLTNEPITLFVQLESQVGNAWKWLPSGEGPEKEALVFHIPAGKTVQLHQRSGDAGLAGRKARIWGESAAGHIWNKYLKTDLALVDEKGGSYLADGVESFVFTLSAPTGPRVLHERTVSVHNDTPVKLLVHGESLLFGPKPEWDATSGGVLVEPGKTVALHQKAGWMLRGVETRIWAEDEKGEHFRWTAHKQVAVKQTDAQGYRDQTIGSFVYVFTTPGKANTPAPKLNSGAQALTMSLQANEVKLPALQGKTLAEARTLLTAEGFKVAASENSPQSHVVNQTPAAGWHPVGTEVRLSVDMPKLVQKIAVPDFLNKDLEAAKALAKTHALEVRQKPGTVTSKHTKDANLAGKVLVEAQSIQAGEKIASGATVLVTLVRYVKDAPTLVKVPNFANLTLEAARLEAKKLGFELHERHGQVPTRTTKESAHAGKTLIESQSHAQGESLPAGSSIEVGLIHYVAEKPVEPQKVAVPNFLNKEFETAKTLARTHALEVRQKPGTVTSKHTKDANLAGKVLVEAQSIQAGEKIASGATVLVTLVRYVKDAPTLVKVPNFANLTLEAARNEAKKLGFDLHEKHGAITTRTTKDPAHVGKTLIESQSHAQGESLAAGSSIEVGLVQYIAEKPPAPMKVAVPNFIGEELERAMAEARRHGLEVKVGGTKTQAVADANLVGKTRVEAQSIARGQEVEPKTVITVGVVQYVMMAPPKVTVPQFTGLTEEQAHAEARKVGLQLQVTVMTKVTKNRAEIGKTLVESQTIASGQMVVKGTVIGVHALRFVAGK